MSISSHAKIEKALSKNHAYYVLITCDRHPSDDEGIMQVKMSYGGGDPLVASYLLHGAQIFLDEEELHGFDEG